MVLMMLSVKCYLFQWPVMHITYNQITITNKEMPGQIHCYIEKISLVVLLVYISNILECLGVFVFLLLYTAAAW